MLKRKNFLGIRYCAMCTVCAPSYANIFLIRFEEKYSAISKDKMELYARYWLHPFLFVWKGTEEPKNLKK